MNRTPRVFKEIFVNLKKTNLNKGLFRSMCNVKKDTFASSENKYNVNGEMFKTELTENQLKKLIDTEIDKKIDTYKATSDTQLKFELIKLGSKIIFCTTFVAIVFMLEY